METDLRITLVGDADYMAAEKDIRTAAEALSGGNYLATGQYFLSAPESGYHLDVTLSKTPEEALSFLQTVFSDAVTHTVIPTILNTINNRQESVQQIFIARNNFGLKR